MSAPAKLYAGVKLREIRARLKLTQADYAARLGVSLSYLNQMENNHRPISARVVLALAQELGTDVTELAAGSTERMVADLREALADRLFGSAPPLGDIQLLASNAPNLARAFLTLHRELRETQERLAQVNEALGREDAALAPLPWEEVRDFFHYCDNYIDAIDRAAETFAGRLGPGERRPALAAWLDARHGIALATTAGAALRRFDPQAKRLELAGHSAAPTQAFQILHQVALLEHDDLLEATLDLARFRTEAARAICKTGLANYFAGAALLPYARFLDRAQALRHDLEALAGAFDASIEQVGQRLSTLQRSGAKGIRSSSSASTRPAPSPSATPRPACNSPASAAAARSGTSTRRSRRRGGSCASSPKRRTAPATSASPATSRSPAAASARRCAATPSASAARSPTPAPSSTPTTST